MPLANHLKPWLRFLLVFALGSINTLGFAPFSFWLAPLISLAIFSYALCLPRSAFFYLGKRLLFAYSFGLLLSGCYWVYVSMHDYGGTAPWLAILLTLVFCGFIASLLVPFFWLYRKIQSENILLNALSIAALWLLCEWFRSWFLTGFPWLYIGYSQTDGPLASFAPIISVYGLSFVICFTAALVGNLAAKLTYSSTVKHGLVNAAPAAVLLTLLWGLSFYTQDLSFSENKKAPPLSVALLQPNVSIFNKWDPAYLTPIKHHLTTSTLDTKADLSIWPETAVPELYHNAFGELRQFEQDLKRNKQAVITGVPSLWHEPDHYYYLNSMIGLGEASGMYHKQKLVPFGEFIPLENWLRGLIAFFDLPMSQFRPGPKEQGLFTVFSQFKTLPYICYEIVYPDFVAQSAGKQDFLLTVSNDAWFGTSIGPAQHLEIARMRALEHSRYLLRSTNTGLTAIIGPNGKVIKQLEPFTQATLTGEVYARKGYTPVAQYGTIAPILVSALIVIAGLILNFRKQ